MSPISFSAIGLGITTQNWSAISLMILTKCEQKEVLRPWLAPLHGSNMKFPTRRVAKSVGLESKERCTNAMETVGMRSNMWLA